MRGAAHDDIQVALRQSCAQRRLKRMAYVVQLPHFVNSMSMVACASQGARTFCSYCCRDFGHRCHFLSRYGASWSTVHVIYSSQRQPPPFPPNSKLKRASRKKLCFRSMLRGRFNIEFGGRGQAVIGRNKLLLPTGRH